MSNRHTEPLRTSTWQVQEAKARFSEMLETALTDGPQIVTKRGEEVAVLVAAEEWHDLQARARPSLKELLLSDEARTDELVPPRRRYRLRPPVDLE